MDEFKKETGEYTISDSPDCSCDIETPEQDVGNTIEYLIKETRHSFKIVLINPSQATLQHMALDGMALAGYLLLQSGYSSEEIMKKKIEIFVRNA